MDVLWDLVGRCSAFCPTALVPSLVPVEVLTVNGRQYRVIKQLGEGGYAFVLLAKELPTAHRPFAADELVAIKKIHAASGEKLRDAKREVEVLKQLSHVNCLPLLDHAINHSSPAASSLAYNVLLVFPAYTDGALIEELDSLAVAGRRFSTRHVLDIFRQICAGVAHMHCRGYAHMDIKPHNVLIKRPRSNSSRSGRQQQGVPVAPSARQMMMSAGDDDDNDAGAEHDGLTDLEAGQSLVSSGYEAVLMDFGSARPVPVHVSSRADALAVQEDAEAHCTATYRAPELFDVPSHCTLDGRMDVWALGCTLYAMMYGSSPFQQALDQGASLALAVMNCHIPWPKPPAAQYPQELHSLVTVCLAVEHNRRPTVMQLLERIQQLMASDLPDPPGAV